MQHRQRDLIIEKEVVNDFIKKFYNMFGYYPTVHIDNDSLNAKSLNVISLNQLEKCFQFFLPKQYQKTLELTSKSRKREIVELRFIFYFLARRMNYTLKQISTYLKKDHSTVIYGLEMFKNLYETNDNFRTLYYKISNYINKNYELPNMEPMHKMEDKS